VDAVGGSTLATILPQVKYRGSVAACGLAGGTKLETTVIPFLLRGVNLLGIDSVMCPKDIREEAWRRLGDDLPTGKLEKMTQTARLEDLVELAPRILNGKIQGRVVIEIGA
jgi:acrylyl-CoA reductase (NADPH)